MDHDQKSTCCYENGPVLEIEMSDTYSPDQFDPNSENVLSICVMPYGDTFIRIDWQRPQFVSKLFSTLHLFIGVKKRTIAIAAYQLQKNKQAEWYNRTIVQDCVIMYQNTRATWIRKNSHLRTLRIPRRKVRQEPHQSIELCQKSRREA